MNVHYTASKLYNEMLGIYCDEYEEFSDAKIKKMGSKHEPTNLMLNTCNYKG